MVDRRKPCGVVAQLLAGVVGDGPVQRLSLPGAAIVQLCLAAEPQPITSANGTTLTATQPGLYSCQVTATNRAGTAAQTSAQVQISSAPGSPALVAAVVSSATEMTKIWREGNQLAQISKKKKRPPVGTTFSFTLNEQASVSFTFTQRVDGR